MKELVYRLFSTAKPEVHRVLVRRIGARCLKVTLPSCEQQPKTASLESELAITSTIRRLNMKAVSFESLSVFLSSCHLSFPQIDAVSIESIDCATTKSSHELIIPSIFSYANPWRINIFRADRFKLKHAIVQPLSFDNFGGLGLTIISTLVTPTVFSGVHRTNGIINAQVNQIDPNEIVVNRSAVQSYETHLDEDTTVKIESILQIPHNRILEASELSATLIEFEKLSSTTIETRVQIVNIKIISVIQCWRNFAPLFALKINAILPPALCERYGILWQFFHETRDECSDFNIHKSVTWFKLSDESLNRGRLANRVTAGIYLLVVPANWECLNLTSPCFVFQEQESLTIDGWQGYLIHVEQNPEDFPRFKTTRGIEIKCDWSGFHRHGIHLHHFEVHQLQWGIATLHPNKTRIKWQNKTIDIEESRFTATSREALWVHIPKSTHIDSVRVGFKPRKIRHKKGIFPIALRKFCDAENLRANGAIFYLWIRDSKREHKVAVLKIKTKAWHCKLTGCSFASSDWEKAVLHFREIHSEYEFRPLLYPEAQAEGLCEIELPERIYQCGYNPQHFVNASSRVDNPTSAISHHIQFACMDAQAQSNGSLPQIRFSVVNDVEKIRSLYFSKPTDWAQCLLCQNQTNKHFYNNIFSHLLEEHKDEIFEWR